MKWFLCSGYYDGITVRGGQLMASIFIVGLIVVAAISVNLIPHIVHKWEISYKTRDLTYGAVCLAMTYALSWAGISMPLGGSITIAALAPIFIYCYYFGFRKGFIVAAAYLLLQFTQKIYICHPLSLLFDYVLPYTAISIVGLFRYKPDKYSAFVKKNKSGRETANGKLKYWAYTVGGHWGIFAGAGTHMIIRYASSVISGVICWDYWGYDPAALGYKLAFSFSYNSVLLIDSAIAIVAILLLLSSRSFNIYMSASFADKTAYLTAVSQASGGETVAATPEDKAEENDGGDETAIVVELVEEQKLNE